MDEEEKCPRCDGTGWEYLDGDCLWVHTCPDCNGTGYQKEDDECCGEPCDPRFACDNCASYWERMIGEGLWDKERNRWTDKGWNDIIRHA